MLKNLIKFVSLFILGSVLTVYAGTNQGVFVDKTSKEIVIPKRTDFTKNNNIVTCDSIAIFVDTLAGDTISEYAGKYYTDCEIKLLDKNGNIIYFFSTIYFNNSEVKKLHPDVADNNAKVYYYRSGSYAVCAAPKFRFSNFNSCIGLVNTIGFINSNGYNSRASITGIQIFPDKNKISLFLDPDNTLIIWRQNPVNAELDTYNNKLWKPALIQYFNSTPTF